MLEIKAKNLGEHHMGSETVRMELPFSLHGFTELYSTNGSIAMSYDENILYLYDSCVVLKINTASQSVEYFKAPWGRYISDFKDTGKGYRLSLYWALSRPKEVLLGYDELNFKKGIGPIKNGLFPSAHWPHVEKLKKVST